MSDFSGASLSISFSARQPLKVERIPCIVHSWSKTVRKYFLGVSRRIAVFPSTEKMNSPSDSILISFNRETTCWESGTLSGNSLPSFRREGGQSQTFSFQHISRLCAWVNSTMRVAVRTPNSRAFAPTDFCCWSFGIMLFSSLNERDLKCWVELHLLAGGRIDVLPVAIQIFAFYWSGRFLHETYQRIFQCVKWNQSLNYRGSLAVFSSKMIG